MLEIEEILLHNFSYISIFNSCISTVHFTNISWY